MELQETFEEIRREAFILVEQYELEAAIETCLLPIISQTLKALRRAELKIGLFSIKQRKIHKLYLDRFNIRKFFDAVTPRNSVKHVEPNEELLEVTLKTLGLIRVRS